MTGTVFNIQRFCTSDGPGIRTTVFLKGCPLRCAWCHNPESQSSRTELMFQRELCIDCMRCVPLCEQGCHKWQGGRHIWEREKCIGCGQCLPAFCDALELCGYEISVEDVLCEVGKDAAFYANSGGGLTLSGGEPLFQFDFCMELLKQAKARGFHTCMESCGFAKTEEITETAKYTDLYLFDYKCTDSEKHRAFIGADNALIIENLYALDALNKKITLRLPIIPGFNDNKEHADGVIRVAGKLKNLVGIEVEPYHSLGESKYKKLGRDYPLRDALLPDSISTAEMIERIQAEVHVEVKKA